jgi:Abortive infection alpha
MRARGRSARVSRFVAVDDRSSPARPSTDGERQSRQSHELDAVAAAVGAVTREIRRAARAIPGVALVEAQAGAGQRFVLREIKRGLNQLDPRRLISDPPRPMLVAPADESNPPPDASAQTVEEKMTALLTRSMHDTPSDSRRTLHEVLVGELVPDEARILSALSDGSSYPLVHIAAPGVGSYQKLVLENASSVGRAAGVALPDRVHVYVSHLRRLGLVEAGPEDHSLKDAYDILLTEPNLRAMIAAMGKGPRGARIIRRTVRMSDLGRELWEAASSRQDAGGDDRDAPAG